MLVLANPLGTTLSGWDAQAPALRDRIRLVRYDHRGHGGSPVPLGPYRIEDLGRDALALLDRLGIERVSFCGLSIGGMVGMWLASEAPERIERLVLCCTSAQFTPPEAWEERAQMVRTNGVGAIADAVLERWFTPAFQADQPDTFEWTGRMLRETPPEGYAGCCEAIRDADLRDRLGNVRAPTLVVAGADDPAAPSEHGERICDEGPDAQLVIASQTRHLTNVERPEEVTQGVLAHLSPLTERREKL